MNKSLLATIPLLAILLIAAAPPFNPIGPINRGSSSSGSSATAGGLSNNVNLTNITIWTDNGNVVGIFSNDIAQVGYQSDPPTVNIYGSVINAQGDIIPNSNATYDLGSTAMRYDNIFSYALDVTNYFLLYGTLNYSPTNGNLVGYKAANSNAITVTNFVGAIHMVATTPLFFNAALAGEWLVTNRIGAVTSCIITNSVAGKSLTGTLIGEASGGSSRVVTLVPDLGHLVSNLDDYSGALATSFSFTLTNGNAVEWSDEIRKLNGTNIHKIVTRQFKF